MPKKIDELHILIQANFGDDLFRLRKLMNLAEELKDLIPDWSQMEADEIFSQMLDIMDECVEGRRERPSENS